MNDVIEERLRASGMELVPLGKRTFAYMIDDMLISTLFVIMLWTPIAQARSVEEIALIVNGVWLYMVMTQILYHTLFIWQYGASLGKMAMKMQVVEIETMMKPRLVVAFNRAVFRIVSGMIF